MTFLGSHTVGELSDLLANWDQQIGQVQNAFNAFSANNVSPDLSAWAADWIAFNARYQAARQAASVVITASKLSPVPNSLLTAEDQYQGVLHAINANAPGPYSDTDFQGLYDRLTAITSAPVPVTAVQPVSTDVDLKAYQGANAATNAMPSWVKTAIATAAPGLVPQTADKANYKALPAWVWPWGVLGGAALAGIVVLKVIK